MIRIALVDDHDLVRMALANLLAQDAEFTVVAEGRSGDEAVAIARKHKPDVILLDINMPGGLSGIEALEKLLLMDPAPRVLFVSQHEEMALIRRLLDRGAMGYVSKTCAPEELTKAIRRVHQGRRFVSDELAQQLAVAPADAGRRSPFSVCSPREMEVVMAVLAGVNGRELAKRLNVTPKTVSTYRMRINEKLGIKSDAELVRVAIAEGLAPDSIRPTKLGLSTNTSD